MTQEEFNNARTKFITVFAQQLQENLGQKLTGVLATGLLNTASEVLVVEFTPLIKAIAEAEETPEVEKDA